MRKHAPSREERQAIMSNYSRGANFERRVARILDADGYFTVRSSGSHGVADIVAIKAGVIMLVQCKINGVLSPADRVALFEVCQRAGAVPLVAYRPTPRKLAYRRLVDPDPRGGIYRPYLTDVIAATATEAIG